MSNTTYVNNITDDTLIVIVFFLLEHHILVAFSIFDFYHFRINIIKKLLTFSKCKWTWIILKILIQSTFCFIQKLVFKMFNYFFTLHYFANNNYNDHYSINLLQSASFEQSSAIIIILSSTMIIISTINCNHCDCINHLQWSIFLRSITINIISTINCNLCFLNNR